MDYVQGYGKVASEPKTTSGKLTITLPQCVIEEIVKHRDDLAQYGRSSESRSGDLGYSHISITPGIYGHVLPGMQQEAMDKLDD